jgi:hypothetical protein
MGSPRLCAASSTAHTARCTVGACASSATRRSAAWQQPPAGARARPQLGTLACGCSAIRGIVPPRTERSCTKLRGGGILFIYPFQ